MSGGVTENGERLDSWKAIAAFLGRDEGTARRWERTRGLPVHRVPGGKGSSVFAFTGEIDVWLRSARQESADPAQPVAQPRSGAWRWLAASTAVVILLFLGWQMQRSSASSPDFSLKQSDRAITAIDAQGRELWVHRMDEAYRHEHSTIGAAARVLGGPAPGVFFATSSSVRRTDDAIESGALTALGTDGRLRWSFRFAETLTFRGQPFGPPWGLTTFAVEDASPRRIAVAAHHWTWGPSVLTILDDNGNRAGTFANDGWIEQLAWIDKDHLAFGGFSESKNGGMVGLVDPAKLDGQSPEPVGSPHHCTNCGANLPLRMAVMPRSEVNLVTQSRFNRAIVEKRNDRLIVRTVEFPALDDQGVGDAIYEFSLSLELVSATYSQRYWEIHDGLEREKKVDHGRAGCPFKNGPTEIHTWSPETGWKVRRLS
jgi:hypothetical protein